MLRYVWTPILLALLVTAPSTATEIRDNFSDAQFAGRVADRGAWKFENQVATCVADLKLYKQYKNHGPILKWSPKFTDGSVQFAFRPDKCQRVVFTLNGDGHIFRVSLLDTSENSPVPNAKATSRLIAWSTKSSKQNKGDTIKPEGFPDLPALNGRWTKLKLDVRDGEAELAIGDFATTLKHPALRREKTMITLSFAYGSLAVRDFHFATSPATGSLASVHTMQNKVGDHQLRYLLQAPRGDKPASGWPLMLFLHGYGECGDEIEKVKKHGPPKLTAEFEQLGKCVIVSPQCPRDSWWRVAALKQLVDEVMAERGDIDAGRIYVTGLSMGGYGTWSLISHYPDFFAAAIPICGGGDPLRLPKNLPPIKQGIRNEFLPQGLQQAKDLPLWTFHGQQDRSVPVAETKRLAELLKQAGSQVKVTIYPEAGHIEAWQNAYRDRSVWQWLFSQRRAE